jgi:uncharacterized protein YidB (DUF937 family)
MAGLGRLALIALGILAYKNRDKLGQVLSGAGGPGSDPNNPRSEGGVAGGLGELLDRFRRAGQGDAVDSWVGKGPNQPIEPRQVEAAIDDETLEALVKQTGMSRAELLRRLAVDLPETVDEITPDGKLPDVSPEADEPTLLDPGPPPNRPM